WPPSDFEAMGVFEAGRAAMEAGRAAPSEARRAVIEALEPSAPQATVTGAALEPGVLSTLPVASVVVQGEKVEEKDCIYWFCEIFCSCCCGH
ncbi:unnamed protein product, partial [Polarella glacialis]